MDGETFRKLIDIYLFSKKGDTTALQKKRRLNAKEVIKRIKITETSRVLCESIPYWLDTRGEIELGPRWNTVIASLNKNSDMSVRVNTLKTTTKNLLMLFRNEGIIATSIEENSDALIIKEKTNVFRLSSFNAGLFEVQDIASQMVSRILDPRPGMRVVDVWRRK